MKRGPRQTDQIVSDDDVRAVMKQLGGDGWNSAMRELEREEPALAAYITTAVETMTESLEGVTYSAAQLRETRQFIHHAMVVVYFLTRVAHRRLMQDFLPNDDGLVRRIGDTK